MSLRSLTIALVCSLVLAAAGYAQVDPEPDGIGIYADLAGTGSTIRADPGDAFEVYLLLTRPTAANGVVAWECGIEVPGNVIVWGWNIQGDYLNVGNGTDFQVAYGRNPLPSTDVVHLMTFIVVAQNASPGFFYINASTYDSGEDGVPNYIQDGDVSTLIPLHAWPAGCDHPAFAVNGDLVADENASWGQVKALFR